MIRKLLHANNYFEIVSERYEQCSTYFNFLPLDNLQRRPSTLINGTACILIPIKISNLKKVSL